MPIQPDNLETPNWIETRIVNFVWRITPACREVARLTSEGRDRALPLGMRMRFALHRCFCTWCARYAKQLDMLHEASHRLPDYLDQMGGRVLGSDAKARMKSALHESSNDDF